MRGIISAIVVIMLLALVSPPASINAQEGAVVNTVLSVGDVVSSINTACINFTVLGPCPVTPLQATHLLVAYYDPVVMVETSPRSGSSILGEGVFDFLGGATGIGTSILTSIATSVTGSAGIWTRGGGASTENSSGNTNLHFHEARVYTIPSIVGQTCGLCSQTNNDFQVNYISDTDVLWRYSQPRLSLEDPILGTGFMGVWGKLNPRVGFLTHGSNKVAGAAAATRATWIAFDPPGTTAIPPDPRIVTQQITPLVLPMGPNCWQLGYPKQARTIPNRCYPPGVNPAYWDRLLFTPDSAMLHFFYGLRTCCVLSGDAPCGFVFAGAGANMCALGLAPGGLLPGQPVPIPIPSGG